jgi:hypothetical protein
MQWPGRTEGAPGVASADIVALAGTTRRAWSSPVAQEPAAGLASFLVVGDRMTLAPDLPRTDT